LVGSGLMIRSFRALHSVDPGFVADGVLTMSIALPQSDYPSGPDAVRFWQQLTERVGALPGVEAVGAVNHLPLDGGIRSGDIEIEDHPVPDGTIPPLAEKKYITPGYFQALRIPVLEGRALEAGDGADGFHAVVVNRSFARHWWPEASPLGRRIRLSDDMGWYEIVGVVGDVRFRSLEQPPQDAVYFPLSAGDSRRALHLAVRTGADPRAFTAAIRQEVWAIDPNLPIADPRAMSEILADSMERTSFTMVMLGIAAAVALLLGTLGIYGVVSYAVSCRTRELGIRIALGATAGRVRRTVVREGLVLAGIGVTIGILAAVALTGILAGLLYEVSASDPLTYALVAVVLISGGALASYVPARRASAVDPMEALRQD
jgi:putative ABC transport system permease protein